jgi:undecaprenyl-diphosphatase
LAAAPLIALLLGGLASASAKAIFGRARPPISLHETTVGLASFPSAHATDATAFLLAAALTLALTLVRRPVMKAVVVAAGVAGAALVGLSRLVLAVHWLSDVVAGWALGTAVAIGVVALAWFITTRELRTRPVEEADHR